MGKGCPQPSWELLEARMCMCRSQTTPSHKITMKDALMFGGHKGNPFAEIFLSLGAEDGF